MRIEGYDNYKIGDIFQVPIKPELRIENNFDEFVEAILQGKIPESIIIKYKTYIRLPECDKEVSTTKAEE